MAWSSAAATQLTSITNTEQTFQFSGSPDRDLNPGETAHVQIEFDPVGSPTDNLEVRIYTSPDGGTTYDVTPFLAWVILNDDDPNASSITLAGVRTFKVAVAATGATDTHTSADCTVAVDGVNL